MVFVRPTKEDEVVQVLRELSERTWDEVHLFLHQVMPSERAEWLEQHVLSAASRGEASTFLFKDQPVGILTWTQEGDWWYTTSLVTERGFQSDFLRLSRRHIAEVQTKLKADVVAYSRSKHEKVDAWFRLMGFHFLRWDDDARLFIRPWVSP